MQIVDAQIHLWAAGLPSYPSHWQVTHFTAEEAIVLMDEGGVDAAVIHPPEWDPGSTALGPVDKPDPDTTASEQDKAQEAACGFVVSGGDAALLLEMADEALDA
jgi:hypothetical protein